MMRNNKSTLPDLYKLFHFFFTDVQGERINKTITFDPTDNSKAITFDIADDEVPSESTEQFVIFLYGTHERYNILFYPNQKTTINILDDGMYFYEIFMRFKNILLSLMFLLVLWWI